MHHTPLDVEHYLGQAVIQTDDRGLSRSRCCQWSSMVFQDVVQSYRTTIIPEVAPKLFFCTFLVNDTQPRISSASLGTNDEETSSRSYY